MTELPSKDQLFLRKLTEIVEDNLEREDFDIEELARSADMSRSVIHRRLKSLGKKNASHFIREIRLQRAREMLHNGFATASEVAYKVGFGSPAYFSKCFHEYYGYPPGEERKRIVPDNTAGALLQQNSNGKEGQCGQNGRDNQSGRFGECGHGGDSPGGKKGIPGRRKFLILSLLIIAAISAIIIASLKPAAGSGQMSIVVLPFRNLSPDPENQYLADGIMEDILNSLFKVSNLRIISRTTSEHFRDTEMTAGEISRKLNARNVLEGSVRRDGNRVRVTVQLIDARSEKHIWSESYDRELHDILGLQGEIAAMVAEKLNAAITSDGKDLKAVPPTSDPEAWDNYLRARFLLHRANDIQRFDLSREGLMACLKYYEMAIAEDTTFAEAYAGLANAWYNLSAWGWYKPYGEGIAMAIKNFTRALELNPGCAEAHALKGVWLAYPERKFEEAKEELRTSLELNPNYSTAHQWYAQILMITGPMDQAREHVDRAVELEPYFWVVHNLSAWVCYFEEEYEKGINACIVARDLNPGFVDNNWLFVLHYLRLGEGEKAATALSDLFRRYPSISYLGDEVMEAYYKSGIDGIFTWLIDININRPVPVDGMTGHPFFVAWWYSILGNREEAVRWFEKTVEMPDIPRHYFNLIATNPDFDILRDDPRFLAVIDKAGLTAYNTRTPR